MGVVYKARDTRLDRTVALKFLPSRMLCDAEARERFEHEAKAASALNHPNIATIYEIDEAEGRCFISMEYIDGGSLKHVIKKGPSIKDALDLLIQVSEGLAAAHESGVVHRDMKPDNIMLTARGTAKITDFGLAKLKGASRVTRTGTTLGTLQYMSPEQLKGEDVDRRSDIFSLGVVLYRMITGKVPFGGDNEAAIINAILGDTPEPLARYKADLPEGLERIAEKALAKDRAERYQHADDLAADLKHERRLLETGSTRAMQSSHSRLTDNQASASSGRRLLPILLPAALVAAAIILFLIFEPFSIDVGPGNEASALENSLAILYFENMVDSEDQGKTAQMITALLITDLSESDHMYVISRQRLYDILKVLGKEDLKVVDRSVASDVAERAGAKWILTGNILQTDPVIVLTSDISDVSTGRIIATQRVTGSNDDDLFAVVDRLSAAVKHDLALPGEAEGEADRPVAEFTTHSAEAYRHYLDGIEYVDKFYTTEACESFRKAIERDSTFAMAYYRMARENPGGQGGILAAKAVEYADHASERERYLIMSLHASFLGNHMEAVRILKEAAGRYPDDKEIHHELAIVYGFETGEVEKCIEQLLKVVELDPMFTPAYNQLAYSYHEIGDFEQSIWAINQYVSLAPDEANPYDSRGYLYAFNGKVDEAMESYAEAVRIKPDFWASIRKMGNMYLFSGEYDRAEQYYRDLIASPDAETRSLGRLCLAFVPAYQGRFEDALTVLEDGIAADRMEQYEGTQAATKHRVKADLNLIRNEFDAALEEARLHHAFGQQLYPFMQIYSWPVYISVLARTGNLEDAEREAEALKVYVLEHDETEIEWYWLARGYIAGAIGDAAATVSSLEKVAEIDPTSARYSRYVLAESYIKLGRLADAISELEKRLYRYDNYRATIPTYTVRAHYLLGRAYEESGWNDRAIEQYEIFLETWKDADPGIREIDDARDRLAGLRESS